MRRSWDEACRRRQGRVAEHVVGRVFHGGSGWRRSRWSERLRRRGTRSFHYCPDIIPQRSNMFPYGSVFEADLRQTRGKRESGRENGEFRVAGAKCPKTTFGNERRREPPSSRVCVGDRVMLCGRGADSVHWRRP